ncbi:MAG: sigma-54-dependent Fis family transcriptional regulator [Flavobacteriales bacterium]|nr:sigma-54-dependent Fis family transcriptional regulator [Flavobacteriales bacterium]
MNVQQVKQRFEIIGASGALDHAIAKAVRVATTDLSVLITGESGVGKENFPKIIHQYSLRKHNKYIAVNCGAIPEGTIDSELFGHEKGSFTGANNTREGYFEVADGGTIFLDEVAELPLQTQVRLLRVLETGEFIKVGSSNVQKTDVRIVAATNVNIPEAIEKGKFREDLFYRLNTVPIHLPALRERKQDIHLLFRKFASDFAEKYRMPTVRLTEEAQNILSNYPWKGNIRQLKNITEQISVLEQERIITRESLLTYLPDFNETKLPALYRPNAAQGENMSDRDLLYKVLFDMRRDVTDLKKLVLDNLQGASVNIDDSEQIQIIDRLNKDLHPERSNYHGLQIETKIDRGSKVNVPEIYTPNDPFEPHEEIEESLSLEEKEKELIKKALEKYKGKRKYAAKELGISERTLYRKINEYELK